MGIISDFQDLMNEAKGLISNAKSFRQGMSQSKSLTKKAKEGVCQFPNLMSKNIDLQEVGVAINKAHERAMASFMEIVMSLNSVVNVSDHSNLADHIAAFHKNMEVDRYSSLFESVITEALEHVLEETKYRSEEYKEFVLEYHICNDATGNIVMENSIQMRDALSDFNMKPVNDLYKPASIIGLMEAASTAKSNLKSDDTKSKDDEKKKEKNVYSISDKGMRDNDVKKANELMPTTLHLRVNLKGEDGNVATTRDFLIGIKSVIHPIPSGEMISNLGNIERGKLFNVVRWTSGEISFFKDLLLNIDGIKTDVVNRSNGANPAWLALKRLGTKRKNFLRRQNNPMPITIVTITREEVEMLQSQNNVNLDNIGDAKNVMSQLALLGIYIYDGSTQTVKVLYDGNGEYQTYSMDSLKREAKDGIGTKEIMKVINRI